MLIAVESWELYNNGILLCKWFDTSEDTIEEVEEYCKTIHIKNGFSGNDMELFIADVEGETLGLITGDESLYQAYEVAAQIDDIGEDNITGIKLMLENGLVSDVENAIEHIDDIHNTGETKMEDIAYNYTNECLEVPQHLEFFFDYEKMGNDMEIEGNYLTDDNGIIWEFVA